MLETGFMNVKIGIVGAGGMLPVHIGGFLAAGAEVSAIADINPVAVKAAAEKHGIPKTYESVAAMLEGSPEIGAVSIILPNKFHAPESIRTLKAGKHVFCEKPPALHAAEAAEMKACAEKADKVLMFNFNNRARTDSQVLMDYIRDGSLGRINSAQARWVRRVGIPGFGGWFTNKALAGGGALIDLLHMMDLAFYFMGCPEPSSVLAATFDDFISNKDFKGPWGIPDVAGGVTDVENAAHGAVRFKAGQFLSFQTSWAEMVKDEEVSIAIQGTGGGAVMGLRLDGPVPGESTLEIYTHEHGRPVNKKPVIVPDIGMGRKESAANFIRVIEGTEAPLNTPDQAVSLMKIIDATYESARMGQPIIIS